MPWLEIAVSWFFFSKCLLFSNNHCWTVWVWRVRWQTKGKCSNNWCRQFVSGWKYCYNNQPLVHQTLPSKLDSFNDINRSWHFSSTWIKTQWKEPQFCLLKPHMEMEYTGSFRKNGKSKTVFMGTKFHEKLIFSAFFSRELATNLRSWATRSVTITLWHPENVAPPVWFQALVGCLKPTTDPETLSKDHKGVLWSVRPPLGILWLY